MTLLVTSTEERTGKTAVALGLATAAERRGRSVGYLKPVGTPFGPTVHEPLDGDPLLAREVLDFDADTHEMEPVVYSPGFLQGVVRGTEDVDSVRDRALSAFEDLEADHDLVVIEGSGSLSTGAAVGLADPDLAAALDATVLLVAPYEEPGDVDDVLAAADAFGDRLGGVLFNAVPDAAYEHLAGDVVPFLEDRGIRVFGAIPYEPDLAGVSVATLAEALDAEVLAGPPTTDEPASGTLVQRVAVGAMTANGTLEALDGVRGAVLVTGGDRADVQTTALATDGVQCLLLAGGVRPPEAVLERADSAGVPVLLVPTDTKTTVDRAEAAIRTNRTRDPADVDRMADLLGGYADVDAMFDPR